MNSKNLFKLAADMSYLIYNLKIPRENIVINELLEFDIKQNISIWNSRNFECKFGIIYGDFNCKNCEIISFEYFPHTVFGNMNLSGNNIKNIKNLNTNIHGELNISDNCIENILDINKNVIKNLTKINIKNFNKKTNDIEILKKIIHYLLDNNHNLLIDSDYNDLVNEIKIIREKNILCNNLFSNNNHTVNKKL